MAYYAALVYLVELLKEINNPEHPYSNAPPEERQVHSSLYEKFSHLQELLGYKESVDCFESRIRDASYRAKYIIESQLPVTSANRGGSKRLMGSYSMTRSQVRTLLGCTCVNRKKKKLPVTSATNVDPDYGLTEYCQELEKVKKEVDSIVEEICMMRMTAEVEHLRIHDDKHLATIKEKLCMKSTNLEVVSIFGAGGTGKTTLARNVFGDKLVLESFDCHVWVCVSQECHLPKVLLSIGNSLRMNKEELSAGGVAVLKTHIYQHLMGRRYLIIMDDVWDTTFWNEVKKVFPNDCNGSRIMITTRESDVAFYASSPDFAHEMQLFNENQSWNLFSEKVFCPPQLEDIGRSIARNCGGLPLAIVVVAGLLSKVNQKQRDWDDIARDLSSNAIENNDHLSNILTLSYNLLPHHLKPCFLYLGGFPEDMKFP